MVIQSQYLYNGLSFGQDLTIGVVSSTGIDDLPDMATGDVQRPRDHGLLAGLDYLAGRSVVLNMVAWAGPGFTLAQVIDQLKAAFSPQVSTVSPLQFCRPGQTTRQILCRARKFTGGVQGGRTGGVWTGAVQLDAEDPRIYDAVQQSQLVTLPTPSSGMTFPATFPLTFGGTTGGGGQISANNAGDFATRPVAVIAGPCVNPRIENVTTGQSISLNITLGPSDTLTIDFDAHTVFLNGTGSRYAAVIPGSTFFELPPGTSLVEFFSQDASPTGATLTLTWSSAWL
jgi:hypothetical protein